MSWGTGKLKWKAVLDMSLWQEARKPQEDLVVSQPKSLWASVTELHVSGELP